VGAASPKRSRWAEAAAGLPGARPAPLPASPSPELCFLVEAPPGGQGWVHEIKYDGYRLLAIIEGGRARLRTRGGEDWTGRFPELAAALASLPAGSAILDGEAAVADASGRTDFSALQRHLQEGGAAVAYFLFDLLYLDGLDLTACPLSGRRQLLARLLAGAPAPLVLAGQIEGRGAEVLAEACRLGLEGVISKRADSPYRGRRSRDWLKTKCGLRQEFVIGGLTRPKGGRSGFGALLLGVYDGKELRYAGRVGTGFDARRLADLSRRLARLVRPQSPFAGKVPGLRDIAAWVEPELVAEVAFAGWTRDGLARQASFVSLREDKPAGEVRREAEQPQEVGRMPKRTNRRPDPAGAEAESVISGVALTSPERLVYPEAHLTKADLANYLAAVAGRMLPLLARRPLTLVRCPEGMSGECFYQRHAAPAFPRAVRRKYLAEVIEGEALYVTDTAGLAGLAQAGVLEIHHWGCRIDRPERPDIMVFDLDPGPGVELAELIAAALEIRERLEGVHLASFVKTTGGKGLHVEVPLARRSTWQEVGDFTAALAGEMAKDHPERYVINMRKALRQGRIFIDTLRNRHGASAVAAYSPRAKPGAPVATPLAWEELSPKLDPAAFTVATLPRRLATSRDPWADFGTLRQALTAKAISAFSRPRA